MPEQLLQAVVAVDWIAVGQIILIDLLLGGDNAVVIALACRNLTPRQRWQGVLWGTVGAVVLRVVLVAFAVSLLGVPGLKIVGALLLFWIGVSMMLPDEDEHGSIKGAASIAGAVRTIIVADAVMSLDNVVAIAGAADQAEGAHQLAYVVFGLIVSIPIIVFGSQLVLRLIDRHPIVVTFGAGLLGYIAGQLIATDALVAPQVAAHATAWEVGVAATGAVAVVATGHAWARKRRTATAINENAERD